MRTLRNIRLYAELIGSCVKAKFLGAFTRLRKAIISFVTCLLVRPHGKTVHKIQVSLKSRDHKDNLHENLCTCIFDIFINCSWVVTRWQYTFTHKQYIEQHK